MIINKEKMINMKKGHMKNLSFILIMILLFFYTGCKKNPVSPIEQTPSDENRTDSTSHNWKFTVSILGDGNGSILHDVAVINDTLIYAVGDIEMVDSTGKWKNPISNVAKWNGSKWEFLSVPFQAYNYDGSIAGSYPWQASTIYCFDGKNIVLTDGADMIKWTEKSSSRYPSPINIIKGSIRRIWGGSPDDFYAIGGNGTIIHYQNGNWKKIESGIDVDMQDIWGYKNSSTGETTIMSISSTVYYGGTESLIKINGNTAEKLNTDGLSWGISGLWFDSKDYYIVGDGMYHKNSIQDTVWQGFQQGLTKFYIESIRANAWNDIVAAGDYGALLHYNGRTWKDFTTQLNLNGSVLFSVSIKGNTLAAVGTLGGDKAVVVIGKRE